MERGYDYKERIRNCDHTYTGYIQAIYPEVLRILKKYSELEQSVENEYACKKEIREIHEALAEPTAEFLRSRMKAMKAEDVSPLGMFGEILAVAKRTGQILDIANHLAGLSLMCEHIGVSLHCIVQATADAGDE